MKPELLPNVPYRLCRQCGELVSTVDNLHLSEDFVYPQHVAKQFGPELTLVQWQEICTRINLKAILETIPITAT